MVHAPDCDSGLCGFESRRAPHLNFKIDYCMKKCITCWILKDESEFWKDKKSKDWLRTKCKLCKRAYDNDYRKKNSHKFKEKRKINNKIYKRNKMIPIVKMLLEKWCSVCWYKKHPAALHFHHLEWYEKLWNVSCYIQRSGKEKIANEIKKCVVLCANCHSIETAKKMNWYSDIDLDSL